MKKIGVVIIIAVVVLGIGLAGGYAWGMKKKKEASLDEELEE